MNLNAALPQERQEHFYIMQNYLTTLCPQLQSYGFCSNPQYCISYHSLANRRRVVFTENKTSLHYRDKLCLSFTKSETCNNQDNCIECHSFEELLYHPAKYKTRWCENSNCSKGAYLCENAHYGYEDLRKPDIVNAKKLGACSNGNAIKETKYEHLDLSLFKVKPCRLQQQHNPKHCIYYHSLRDRRRLNFQNYIPELCEHAETDQCILQDACNKSHNRVEQLYHPEKYKSKFCSFYPYKLNQCEYCQFCSFAHAENDIKVELIHNMVRDNNFYIYHYKSVWCPFNIAHDKAMCLYAHNWQDFRRKPQLFPYQSDPCPNWKSGTFILSYEEGGCQQMNTCMKCHGWKEQEYHPQNYKTRPCTAGVNCQKGQDCPYYHSCNDKR